MKKLLNTLYVTTQGAYLAKEGEAILVRVEGETRLRLPVHNLDGIVCFGNVLCSPFLLGHCAANGVQISFLTENGRFLARVQGEVSGNVLLRHAQHRLVDDPGRTADLARLFVLGKITNTRVVLNRAARDRPDTPAASVLRLASGQLAACLESLRATETTDQIRGVEGQAAQLYFAAFPQLITADDPAFVFTGRNRRPPRDPVNALLSFLYVLLAHDIRGALEGVGLDPAVGFLHALRPGRPSLALDLMEELRPFLADRLALSLINRAQLRPVDFSTDPAGGVRLADEARRTVLKAYQERKRDEITHPFLGEQIPVGLVPHVQALLLARHLRGDLSPYPPFAWK
jgi:CRISPR-associated protein Cas1